MDRSHFEKTTKYYNQTWNSQGTRKRGRLKNIRRRNLEKHRSNFGKSLKELEILAKDRRTWNVIVTGVCPHGS
jgi:hypothetical protein